MLFSGALTALVTPFKDEALDEEAYRNFIEFQITEGIHGLVPCGTTGESATLSHEEHESNDVWDDGDHVGITIAPDKIRIIHA